MDQRQSSLVWSGALNLSADSTNAAYETRKCIPFSKPWLGTFVPPMTADSKCFFVFFNTKTVCFSSDRKIAMLNFSSFIPQISFVSPSVHFTSTQLTGSQDEEQLRSP